MEKISRTKIVDLLKREDFGAMVNVKGWVRTRRGSKQVNFIALNDGSTINNVQIVVDRKSTRLNSSHQPQSRMPSSA